MNRLSPPLYLLVVFCLLMSPALMSAQEYHPLPHLKEGADPRDPKAYYDHGIERIVEFPDSAAEAFYWASKLDPTWAEPLYSRWVALHLTDKRRLFQYVGDNEDVLGDPEIRSMDSLAYRALQLDPFFYRRMDYLWYETLWKQSILDRIRGNIRFSDAELNYILDSLMTEDTTSWVRAFNAYADRRFKSSLIYYSRMLEDKEEDKARVHVQRGRVFFLTKQYDSCQVAFGQAIEELRERDDDELVIIYESKAALEYGVGMALEATGRRDAAMEAYSRGLMEDLSYYPAHQRLGALALEEGDTVTAVSEFELATESDPTAILPLMFLGRTLHASGRYQEAAEYLLRAIELEPYYAELYHIQGLVYEAMGDNEAAVASYTSFSGLATASDERQESVVHKIAELGGS